MAMTVLPAMVQIYANLVVNGVRTIESLPEIYRQPVQDYINTHKD